MGSVGLRDAEKVNLDGDGVDQYEVRELTDVEIDVGFTEHVMTFAHRASPQTVDASTIKRRCVKRLEPVLGGLRVPQGILARKRDVEF